MLRTPRKQSAIRRADLSPVLLSERLQPRKEIRIIKRDLRYGLAAEFLYLRQQSIDQPPRSFVRIKPGASLKLPVEGYFRILSLRFQILPNALKSCVLKRTRIKTIQNSLHEILNSALKCFRRDSHLLIRGIRKWSYLQSPFRHSAQNDIDAIWIDCNVRPSPARSNRCYIMRLFPVKAGSTQKPRNRRGVGIRLPTQSPPVPSKPLC